MVANFGYSYITAHKLLFFGYEFCFQLITTVSLRIIPYHCVL